MASTSFSLSATQIHGRAARASSPPYSPNLRPSLRISASGITSHALQQPLTASFYEVLGIRTGATCQEIKSAYRSLALVLHPDAARGETPPSADEFMRVHAAYATLSDPKKREVYDRTLLRRPRAAAVPSVGGFCDVSVRRRTWETDQCW